MFRNMNSNLIISIGVSLILCGAIVYYCNTRLNNVETAIMRQNQVLSSFIANMQNELRGGGALRGGSAPGGGSAAPVLSDDVSTPEARQSAEAQSKIVVSDDDDDDDDDDDSSSESDTDDDVEDNDNNECENKIIIINNSSTNDLNVDNEVINIKEINLNDETHYIKIVDVTNLSMFVEDLHDVKSPSTIYEINDDSDDEESSESDDEQEQQQQTDVINLGNATIKIEKSDEQQTLQTPLKVDQMRVDDLRKMVIEKNLSTKDEVKKLKKPELLFLLQQQPLEKVVPNPS